VSGALFDDGAAVLREQGLLVLKVSETSDEVEPGVIIRTDPVAGTQVPERTPVTVYVSAGKLETQVPLLVGMTEEEARTALETARLVLGTITPANSANIAKGLVIETSPVASSKLAEGSIVNLIVSDGQVMVPNVINLNISDAQRTLQAPEVGFTVIIEAPIDCVGSVGSIVETQSIEPGLADQKSEITLTLNCIVSE
jgi:beta-lactam-binding protein with PASTA domain